MVSNMACMILGNYTIGAYMEIIKTDKFEARLGCGVKRREFLKGSAVFIPAVFMAKKSYAGWTGVVVAISGAIVAAIEVIRFIEDLRSGMTPELRSEDGGTVIGDCIGCHACLDLLPSDDDVQAFADAINSSCPVVP